jgi:prepilin-type N-terminal cleavage/methylation domain-containing protein
MQRQTQSGFTLIETVISLVMLSFIALIGYQGLIFGMEQWRKGHDRLEFRYSYQQAMGWVRNALGTSERVVDRRISMRSLVFDGKRNRATAGSRSVTTCTTPTSILAARVSIQAR